MDARRLLLTMLGAVTLTCACERTTSVGAAGRPADTDAALDGDAATDASPDDKCQTTGGTVQTGFCCSSVSDFPGMCSGQIGLCGCGPTASHMISLCECPSNKCFDAVQGCVTQ